MTKFIINDEMLLMEVPEADRASEVKDVHADTASKALGIKIHGIRSLTVCTLIWM